MKKFFYFVPAVLIATLMLGSCSTSNDVASNGLFQKRKYNKGYNLNLKKNDKSEKAAVINENYADVRNAEDVKTINAELKANKTVAFEAKETTLAKNDNAVTVQSKKEKTAVKVKSTAAVNTVKSDKEAESTLVLTEESQNNQVKKLASETKNESSNSGLAVINLVLLVILAIILPPLAVGIATDWAIGPLLLSILLTLLFWLPGIIYALIVVFNAG